MLNLKQRIQDKTGIDPDRQRLIVGSQQLNDDHKLLKDYNIENNSTVYMVIRVVGGEYCHRRISEWCTHILAMSLFSLSFSVHKIWNAH